MAIETTHYVPNTSIESHTTRTHVGRVVEVKRFKATRNMSDTLDYSDFQTVNCVTAVVYMGRVLTQDAVDYPGYDYAWFNGKKHLVGDKLELADRFTEVDCSNHFAWRNSSQSTAFVDDMTAEMAEDYAAYRWMLEQQEAERQAVQARRAAQDAQIAQERERNRAVVGKKMKVARGRKVPIGFEGTVAFIRDGAALLKDDAAWQDRKAQGRWVNVDYLVAR